MEVPVTGVNATSCRIDNPVQKKFFRNPTFCLCIQEYLQKLLSIQIAIIPRRSPKNRWNVKKESDGYTIHVLDAHENKTEMEQAVSDFMRNLFETLQSQIFSDGKVQEWLQRPSTKVNHLECLQKIMDEKIHHVFVVCEENTKHSLEIHYLTKQLFTVSDSDEVNKIIQSKISQEVILLPFRHEQSKQIEKESKKIIAEATANGQVSVSFDFADLSVKKMQKAIIVFGYYEAVDQLKKELLKIIDRDPVKTFKLNFLEEYQIEFLLKFCRAELGEIEEKYEQFGVDLQLRLNEFSAPPHLKDEIESSIKQLLPKSTSTTFKSIPLTKEVAEIAEKHLKPIARRNHCYMTTKLIDKTQCYTIPKALSSNTQVLQSVVDQSALFIYSSDVFNRMVVANGSIEIRTGDIALQNVNVIVVPTTLNGLKEGVIERAGAFDYEYTYTDATGTKFTETNGGRLSCKRILFSNWMPIVLTNDDNDLRKSIQIFISKSIEYATKERNPTSIAFAVSDSPTNERILAEEMIAAVKQEVTAKNLQLQISFILLPEQHTLRDQFFTLIGAMQNSHAQFDWSTTVIEITLLASEVKDLTKCEEKLSSYLKRCVTSMMLTNANGIFQHWDQYTINVFYKYCKDKCVLPQIDRTNKELEISGSVNNVREVKQKWHVLSDLAKEKASRTSTTERPSSAAIRSARLDTGTSTEQTKVYNVMLSYCQQDLRKCQHLINRLTEEGLSIWAEPAITEQQRDVSSQINKSECIVLCISENYYECQSCEKETKYAFQTDKPVFLVKIQNHSLIGWQREVFEGKSFFLLFGSKNHFDLECGELLLKILRYTKPGYISLLQQRSGRLQLDNDESRSLLTVEQRRSKYDEKIKTLMNIGHIEEKEMKTLIEQLQNVINHTDQDEKDSDEQDERTNNDHWNNQNNAEQYSWIERWLRKPTNMTKQNLPPFTASGDINDALFPMPEYMLQDLGLYDRSFSSTQSSPIKLRYIFECNIIKRPVERLSSRDLLNQFPVDEDYTHGICTQKIECSNDLSQVFPDWYPSTDKNPQKRTRLPCLPAEIPKNSENKARKHRDLDYSGKMKDVQEEIAEYSVKKCGPRTRKERDVYFKQFAQRMKENAIQFEMFCATTLPKTMRQ